MGIALDAGRNRAAPPLPAALHREGSRGQTWALAVDKGAERVANAAPPALP